MRAKIFLIGIIGILFIGLIGLASAANVTVCCEKTSSGQFCQDVPPEQCAEGAKQVPTSCKATSYCKPGICYDSNEGTCLDNTPQNVCNAEHGIWSDKPVPQCDLGCCLLGDQAAFVTLTRCKKLSSFLGLETNYKKDIKNEVACILSVQGQEKGACVYESDLQKKCRFTTRANCGASNNGTKEEFFKNKLCSAEELGTVCGPTTKTICVPGKEEVYFVDSCGNPANIYDSSKINDKNYWADVKDKISSCGANSANINSAGCGNCNYLLGSFCRASSAAGGKATYGDSVCADLNCKKTSNGNDYKHGESWCVFNDAGKTGAGNNAVGSRFYKHICMNGEEILEQCAEYRQHECIESAIATSAGKFSQAACRVNRWQDCVLQATQDACENTDKRDCIWKTVAGLGRCVPKNSPGLKFWEEDAVKTCSQASITCTATYTKGLIGDAKWKGACVDENGNLNMNWWNQATDVCHAVGDCTEDKLKTKLNWAGSKGY